MEIQLGPFEHADRLSHRARRVNLAHERPFALGPLTVDPGARRIAAANGREELVEPRIMQVLVALAQADGAILTRDELVESCWDGRIVGEDAITRVISRLRRLADGVGQGVFSIETLTKVGYRLVRHPADGAEPPRPAERERSSGPSFSRRAFMAGGAAAGAAATGGVLIYGHSREPASPSPETEALMAQAWQAWAQGTSEGSSQAIGLYRRVTEIAPGFADGWGFLAVSYGDRAHLWARAAERAALRERAASAGHRALALDPRNASGRVAIAYARPMRGNWLSVERAFLRAIGEQPDKWLMPFCLAVALGQVGRFAEASARFALTRGASSLTAVQFGCHAQSLWASGRLDEAERVIDEAMAIYATNPLIWRMQLDLLLFGGRPSAATALVQNADVRPPSVSDQDIEDTLALAGALETRDPAKIAAVSTTYMQRARESAGQATLAIQVASALGRMDDAFALAEAYYFSRGFTIPDMRVPAGQTPDVSLAERATRFLFLPSTRAMVADPRFGELVNQLGLERYWAEAGTQPDFRRLRPLPNA